MKNDLPGNPDWPPGTLPGDLEDRHSPTCAVNRGSWNCTCGAEQHVYEPEADSDGWAWLMSLKDQKEQ